MTISKLYFVLTIQFYLVSITICQHTSCVDNGYVYTNTSTYKSNLDTLLSSISSTNQTDSGFYNISVGTDPDKANGIALCRGDVEALDCHKCLNDSATKLPQICPTQKEAILWFDNCMLHYANRTILGTSGGEQPTFDQANGNTVRNPEKFDEVRGKLLRSLQSEAASGSRDSGKKFATGQETVDSYQNIYALAQCTPDLPYLSCFNCLGNFINVFPSCCANSLGAQIQGPICSIRYEIYQFYNSPISPPPPTYNSTSSSANNKSKATRIGISITVPTVVSIFLAVGFCLFCRRKKWRKVESTSSSLKQDESISLVSLQYGFDDIRVATDNFSYANKLGRGGFGTVYKGNLTDGHPIAVKRLSMNSGQGDDEFKTEVLLVARLQHRNLVRLLGFCLEKEERLIIYEFVPNTSLDHFLFDVNKRSYLDWEKRYKIIIGIARGVLYLHEDSRLRIIHRDLKASNILLDADLNPKIADFGMAKLFQVDQTQGDTSRIVGTYGYMAPEYVIHGSFSVKSDVYSFGVLVLEIITGQKNKDSHNGAYVEDLIRCVWRNWREGTPFNIVDPIILTGPRDQILRCIHMGLLCVQENVEDRPTMSSAVLMLSSYSLTMPMPSHPAFVTITSTTTMETSSDQNHDNFQGHSSSYEDSITDLHPR